MKSDLPQRKANRLPLLRYFGRQLYFVTVCSQNRRKLFKNADLNRRLTTLLHKKCSKHGFGLYAYCFMPDHVHLQLVGLSDDANLQAFVRAFKGTATTVARGFGVRNLWQKGFYDHVLRPGEGVDSVAWYIFHNPVRAGLIEDWKQWPFSGSAIVKWKHIAEPVRMSSPSWKDRENRSD